MVALLFAGLLTAAAPTPIHTDYKSAYQESIAQDKPLMVIVGAPWCPACNVLKQTTIEPMAATGELDDVSLAMLDRDANPELVKQLTKGVRTLPQIILFAKTDSGQWKRRDLKGYQSKQPIRNLIRAAKTLGRG